MANAPTQQFAYRGDYSLVLAGTQSATSPGTGGMCVTADQTATLSYQDLMPWNDTLIPSGSGIAVSSTSGPLDGSSITMSGSGYFKATKQESWTILDYLSVGAWVKVPKSGYGGTVISANGAQDQSSSSTYDHVLSLDSQGRFVYTTRSLLGVSLIPLSITLGSASTTTWKSWNDDKWHYVVGASGSLLGGIIIFVDGQIASDPVPVLSALLSIVSNLTNLGRTSAYWHIGWGPKAGYFKGSLAHVSVWNKEIFTTPAQATAAATQSALLGVMNSSGAHSYWPLTASGGLGVTFQTCDGANHQKWGYNAAGKFEIIKSDGSAMSGQCVSGATPTVSGGALVMPSACSSSQVWKPDASVGAGAAGAATFQLVNAAEYARCLHVTNQDPGSAYLVDQICVQDPSQSIAPWYERWVWDGSGSRQLQTTYVATSYCLTAPSSSGGYVTTQVCGAGRNDQQWTVNGDTGSRTSSYTIVSDSGQCLDLASAAPANSRIVLNPCTGVLTQKWNAPPQVGEGGVLEQRENTTG